MICVPRMMRIIYSIHNYIVMNQNVCLYNQVFPKTYDTSPLYKKRGTKCSPFTSRRLVDQLLLLHKVCNFDLPVVLVSCTRNRDCTFSSSSNRSSMERISSNTISGLKPNLRLESMFSNCTNHL